MERPFTLDQDQQHYHSLSLLAQGLAHAWVDVLPLTLAEQPVPASLFGAAPSGPPRAVLTTGTWEDGATPQAAPPRYRLLLPPLPKVCRQQRLSQHQAMVAHAVAHVRHSPAAQPAAGLTSMGLAVVSAVEDARVELLLIAEFPGLRPWFEQALAAAPALDDLGFTAFMARLDRVLLLPGSEDRGHWPNKARQLFQQALQKHGLQDYAAFRALASILANDLGQARVRMPQDYAPPSPCRDDNSYLWRHAKSDAEQALALPQAQQRQRPATRQALPAPPPADLELGRFSYPEWNHVTERLRPDWCTVIEKLPAWPLPATADRRKPAAPRLAPWLLPRARQLDRRQKLRRQWEGEDIDLHAAIDVLVHQRLGLQPEPRLFLRPGKAPRPTSLLVLLDVSESVNDASSATPQGVSLLEIEKQAALLLAHSPLQGANRLAIHAFCSNTRAQVFYYRLLDFGQPCSDSTSALLDSLAARYSTRLGAALRHANSCLQEQPWGQRSVLVITDGQPSDIDVHEPRYLIEDARRAVLEARSTGTRMACLSVDAGADDYVRHIFGWRNFSIAQEPGQLPARLMQMAIRLAT
ncbi:nitric oxide reductase activation protein NorD [Comamonas composti]|uniref:nitric oxide reductase activation protein NorD n=1 Tax=Comamonas composti TaxID=408558 RepID=UPI00040F8EE2|nr:VWA domain-containing protein [Comamonas composti]